MRTGPAIFRDVSMAAKASFGGAATGSRCIEYLFFVYMVEQMKATELIKCLTELVEEHGDKPIEIITNTDNEYVTTKAPEVVWKFFGHFRVSTTSLNERSVANEQNQSVD